MRSVSMAAGLHDNFITQLRAKNWREPMFGNVVALCRAIDVSITYVVTGAEMTQSAEMFLSQLARLSEDQQRSVLALLESFPPGDERIQ
jgi:hypothetical protein